MSMEYKIEQKMDSLFESDLQFLERTPAVMNHRHPVIVVHPVQGVGGDKFLNEILHTLTPNMRSDDQATFLRFCFRHNHRIRISWTVGYNSEKVIPVIAGRKVFY